MSFFPACEHKESVISGVSLKSSDHKEKVVFFPFKFQCISHFNHFKAILVAVRMYIYVVTLLFMVLNPGCVRG